jgi:chromosome segregation protein
MRLKQLKLSGFKSFVDPTVVHFPSQLVAVVGPNGCGKSNIIDAVRWVLGEGSARNLRGESMTDVIFNGSSSRKPVGRASVELLFDNSLGRLGGSFASYSEISVKRVITRDGNSSYYMNGSCCRRKDITHIFLGTGARSYSIIGQGTVSQLIEAKPEDLRVFLEEAAGISKYKERRKETFQRIAHTRENLTRVADIRDELGKQVQRLEHQAQTAERYLALKDQEHLCRAEILALKWRDFVAHQEAKQDKLRALALTYEEQQSLLTEADTQRTVFAENLHEIEEQTQKIQTTFYGVGTEIARLEESIIQQARDKKRLEQDQQQIQEDWQIATEGLKQDREKLLNCQQSAEYLEKQLVQLRVQFKNQEEALHEVQKQQQHVDLQYQEVQMQCSTAKKEFEIAQIQEKHLEQKQQQTLVRMERLKLEQDAASGSDLQKTKKDLEAQQNTLVENQAQAQLELKQCQKRLNQSRIKIQETEQKLYRLQDEFHHAHSEHAALVAVQAAARQSTRQNMKQLVTKPQLMDVLHVEPDWQFACELVLQDSLHAYVLERFDKELWSLNAISTFQGAHVITLRTLSKELSPHPRLVDKIQGAIPAHIYPLEHVFAAEHFDEALSWLPKLLEHQSIITPEGDWLGPGWVKYVKRETQDELGFLSRQQKISELTCVVEELRQKINEFKELRDYYHQQVQKRNTDYELKQLEAQASNEALTFNTAALSAHDKAILHANQLAASLSRAYEELQVLREQTSEELWAIKDRFSALKEQCQNYEKQQEQCFQEKKHYLDRVASSNKHLEETRRALHDAELDADREKNKIRAFEQKCQLEEERSDVLQGRLEQLKFQSLQTEKPTADLKNQLEQHLVIHTELKSQLVRSNEQMSQVRKELEDLEKNSLTYRLEVKKVQELISQIRMQEQEFLVRARSVQESIGELGFKPQDLLVGIPQGLTQNKREEELLKIIEHIKGLGAINLVAIEEFATEQQRKVYLDKQYHDLSEALSILEQAIEKIDKETRVRFKDTFHQVNTLFQALFPRLFGGGKAQLELTCEDLLEAGIVVMAQPPGKRNSTIHLLSGGEKAMTAVALVLALFQLNPSPFCMLDEVDAPLDDVNVGRFCALVKEMSQFVQFLFITHNKITMELADHLMGVTCGEPGVSRLVAVDVTQALAME